MHTEWAINLLAIQQLYIFIDSMNLLMLFLSFKIESSDKQISLDLIYLYELIEWVMRLISCDERILNIMSESCLNDTINEDQN